MKEKKRTCLLTAPENCFPTSGHFGAKLPTCLAIHEGDLHRPIYHPRPEAENSLNIRHAFVHGWLSAALGLWEISPLLRHSLLGQAPILLTAS